MKTIEERAREIRRIFGILDEPDNLEWICATIRADREALLDRVALTQRCRIDSFDNNLAAVRKEAL